MGCNQCVKSRFKQDAGLNDPPYFDWAIFDYHLGKYPNIEEVYRGYNIYKASPSSGVDSGFAADVYVPNWD